MISKLLRWIGHATPNIRYIRAIPSQILWPLHKTMSLEGGVVNVLGFKMRLDPRECVDAGLWFAPHLYDRAEIDFLAKRFSRKGVFVDVGANIGFWSLRFSYSFADATICAIEANPATFKILRENVQINGFQNISLINVGVSDNFGELPLYCNDNGNRGGDSFTTNAGTSTRCVMVPVKPLTAILSDAGLHRVDVMKMDIEGFEGKVLKRFFSEAPRGLWPCFICVEMLHVPQQVASILETNGYRMILVGRENRIFELVPFFRAVVCSEDSTD